MFKKYLQDQIKASGSGIVINANSVIPLTKTRDVLVIIKPSDLVYAFVDSVNIVTIKITAKELDVTKIPTFGKIRDHSYLIDLHYGGMESVVKEGGMSLEISLGLQTSPLQLNKSFLTTYNILILGKMGSGKSTLAKEMCQNVKKLPYFVHCRHVQCKQYKGKKVETLQKLFSQWLVECVYYQPSVLVLDDLDALAGPTSVEREISTESLYFTRVSERLLDLLEDFQARHYISVIATAVSLTNLNSAIVCPRGQHLFKTILQVPELNKVSRLVILKNIISQKTELSINNDSSLDLRGFAGKTDGFVVQDLTDLVDKAIFHAWKSRVSDGTTQLTHLTLRDVDMEEAMKNSVPLSLYGVDLYQSTSKSWADVGGLVEVKKVLIEVLQWPSQYPELFENAPLRHQSGLLLYGAPGTGKTLLAGAVAHECDLKFISVKGPELLSKYIGASEEAVRNIFQTAESARPCILFFDEFDSLAPRRGHDSTGVTDRVVNQLLTQLDGVESLQGVWVMAATSRPDMLDPALLRPGRLDKAVHCPLPNMEERLSILQALSRKLSLSSEVNLQTLAEPTEGFTGADLQAVLYTAQLMAVEKRFADSDNDLMLNLTNDKLPYNVDNPTSLSEDTREVDNPQPSGSTSDAASVEITQMHLMTALRETRPSLSTQESLKYKYIYEQFVGSRNGAAANELARMTQRTTLA